MNPGWRPQPGRGGVFHINAFVHDRTWALSDLPTLVTLFDEFDGGDLFVRQMAFPSLFYREHVRKAILNGGSLRGNYLGNENLIGYSQILFDVRKRKIGLMRKGKEPYPLDGIFESGRRCLEKFLMLAGDIGAPVVLLSSPEQNWYRSGIEPFENLITYLRENFRVADVIRIRDYDSAIEPRHVSNDSFGHLNDEGAEAFSAAIAERLGLKGQEDSFGTKLDHVVKDMALPSFKDWTFDHDVIEVRSDGMAVYRTERPRPLMGSPEIPLDGPGEYVAEVEIVQRSGRYALCGSHFEDGAVLHQACNWSPEDKKVVRIFVRLRAL